MPYMNFWVTSTLSVADIHIFTLLIGEWPNSNKSQIAFFSFLILKVLCKLKQTHMTRPNVLIPTKFQLLVSTTLWRNGLNYPYSVNLVAQKQNNNNIIR